MKYYTLISKLNLVYPAGKWLESIEVQNSRLARLLCKIIPASCPFEREIKVCKRTIFHIPPLCKLNPLYDQIVELRFKSLSYLVDKCGEDITYC